MGRTIVTLADASLPPRLPSLSTMLVDLAENVHIHCRELRQEFSVDEFFLYVEELLKMAWDLSDYLEDNPEYREDLIRDTVRKATGAPSMLDASPAPSESAYWPCRLLVELIEPHEMGDIHLHYRDYRVQMTRTEFRTLAEAIAEARERLDRVEVARFPDVVRRQRTETELRQICQDGKSQTPGPGHFRAMLQERKP